MLDLAPIKKRLANATSGPWVNRGRRNVRYDNGRSEPLWAVEVDAEHKREDSSGLQWEKVWIRQDLEGHDADLIANAPTDLEALVAEAELLRSIVKDMVDDVNPSLFHQVETWDCCPHCEIKLTITHRDESRHHSERMAAVEEHSTSCTWRRSMEYLGHVGT